MLLLYTFNLIILILHLIRCNHIVIDQWSFTSPATVRQEVACYRLNITAKQISKELDDHIVNYLSIITNKAFINADKEIG